MKNSGRILNSILIVATTICLGFLIYILFFYINDYFGENEGTSIVISTTNTIDNNKINKEDNKNTEQYNIQPIEPVSPSITTSNNNTTTNVQKAEGYYYKQLDEDSKVIYDALASNIENLKTGVYKIQFNNEFDSLLKQENGSEMLNYKFQVAWDAFYYDKPEVFYLDATKFSLMIQTTTRGLKTTYNVYIDNGQNANYLQAPYTSKEQIDGIITELEDLKQQFKSQMLNMNSDEERIKAVHNWIIDNVEYDINMENSNRYTICGALQDKKAVCEGYAKLFKYIIDSIQIENVLVSGTAINSKGQAEKHMWNYVNLNGIWYGVDCTWDDPIMQGNTKLTDNIRYKYFLKGNDVFAKSHQTEPITANNITLKYPEL